MRQKIGILLTLLGLGMSASAQDYSRQVGFKSDNDAYLAKGQDKYYTNGIFISYRFVSTPKKESPTLVKQLTQLELGQKMYNAQSGYIPDIIYVDRPITTYLYAGASKNWFYSSENSISLGVQLGTIGPNALGRQAQEFIHKLGGFYPPKGWEYQLNNELGLNFSLAYTQFLQRSASKKLDLSINTAANLGNTYSGLSGGFTLRTGRINPFYTTAYNRSNLSEETNKNTNEFFFFARPQLDWVAYDASISGGLFRKDKGPVAFKSKPWVLSQEFGLVLSKNRWSAQLSYTFKTHEINSPAKADQYGSLSTYYQFR
ncbi:MAG: lipid A deacylase LpxR family protein [Sphingobacteriaceae bacterium]